MQVYFNIEKWANYHPSRTLTFRIVRIKEADLAYPPQYQLKPYNIHLYAKKRHNFIQQPEILPDLFFKVKFSIFFEQNIFQK